MQNAWTWIKEHPVMSAMGVILILILLYVLFKGSSQSYNYDPNAASAAEFQSQTQAATQLAVAQAAQQAAGAHDQAQLQGQQDLINGQVSIATLNAQTQQSRDLLAAGIAHDQTAAGVTIAGLQSQDQELAATLSAQTAQQANTLNSQVALQGLATQLNIVMSNNKTQEAEIAKLSDNQLATTKTITDAQVANVHDMLTNQTIQQQLFLQYTQKQNYDQTIANQHMFEYEQYQETIRKQLDDQYWEAAVVGHG